MGRGEPEESVCVYRVSILPHHCIADAEFDHNQCTNMHENLIYIIGRYAEEW